MPATPTVRLFVSSTFSDLTTERDVLQREVFPALRQHCIEGGFRFQPIDLRWGISEEAGRHNRTMRVCLRELQRCQADHPKPNFLILLGERYGWRPLPELVPAALFRRLSAQIRRADPDLAETLERWYRVDQNAVPPVAELQARGDADQWSELVEAPLLQAMEQAARSLGIDLAEEGVSIGTSATEQEIVAGALSVGDAASHVRAFFRTIEGLPDPPPAGYVDAANPRGRESLARLQQRIATHLGDSCVHRFTVPWRDGVRTEDLGDFAARALDSLRQIVTRQMQAFEAASPSQLEADAHRQFGRERRDGFVGRDDTLEQIHSDLLLPSGSPLAIVGPAGSGKSAVMATVADRLARERPDVEVIARFIGATPSSADLMQLLGDLIEHIRRRYPVAGDDQRIVPADLDARVDAFLEALQRPSAAAPLTLILDGLDQLTAAHGARDLWWLPRLLPSHTHVVVSASSPSARPLAANDLPPHDRADAAVVWLALNRRVAATRTILLPPLSVAEGGQMLARWLSSRQRTLRDEQRDALLQSFAVEGRPLWLRIAADEASRLPSWAAAPDLPPTTEFLVRAVFARLSRDEEHGGPMVSRTLGYLTCARHGLAEDELIDVLSRDETVMTDFRHRSPQQRDVPESSALTRLPVSVWVALLGDLSAYLAEHEAQDARLLAFYHRSVADAVGTSINSDLHHRLAEYFHDQAHGDEDPAWQGASNRSLTELAYHLRGATEFERLAALYSDMTYVDARCRSLVRRDADAPTSHPGMLEFITELRDATTVLTAHNAAVAEPLADVVRLLIDRNAMLVRYPASTAQEIANYLDRYSASPASRAIAERARRIPAAIALRTGTYPNVPEGHTVAVTALAASASGRDFVSGAADGTVGYWGAFVAHPRWVVSGHEQRVTSIALSPDGRRAVTASRDGSLVLWTLSVASPRLFRPFGPHAADAWVGGFIDDDTVIGVTAGVIFALDLDSGTVLWRTDGEGPTPPALSSDGRLVCAYGDRPQRPRGQRHTLQLYSVGAASSTELATLPREPEQIVFNRTNDMVIVADGTGHVLSYARTGERLADVIVRPPVGSWCRMPDDTIVASDLDGQLLRSTPPPVTRMQPLTSESLADAPPATALAPLPNNRLLAGYEDGAIALVDLTVGIAGRKWGAGENFVTGAILARGEAAAITGERRQGESILGRRVFRVSAQDGVTAAADSPHAHFITGIAALGPDVMTVDLAGRGAVWEGGIPKRVFDARVSLTCAASCLDANVAVAGTSDDAVLIVDRSASIVRVPLPKAAGTAPGVSALAAAGHPLRIVAALHNSEVASTDVHGWRAKAGSGMGTAAALSTSHDLAATGHAFGRIHLWNLTSGAEIGSWLLHAGPVMALTFDEGGRLYSAGADRCVLAVDPASGRVLGATTIGRPPVAMRFCDERLVILDSSGALYEFECDLPAGSDGMRGRSERQPFTQRSGS